MATNYWEQGLAFRKLNKLSEAIECFDKVISQRPKASDGYTRKASILALQNKLTEAIECYDKYVSQNPSDSTAYLSKGGFLAKHKKFNEALVCYDKAISLDPTSPWVYNAKAKALCDLNKVNEALECYDRLISICPNDKWGYQRKGQLCKDQKKLNEAIACYDKGISFLPNELLLYQEKAEVLQALNKPNEALECYDKFISLSYENDRKAYAYIYKGRLLKDQNKLSEALACYDKAISLDPKNREAVRSKAEVFQAQNKLSEAIEYWSKDIALEPADTSAYEYKAALLSKQNKLSEAIGCYDTLISHMPIKPKGYILKASFLNSHGKLSEAIACYGKGISEFPNEPLFYYNRGSLSDKLGQTQAALQDYSKAKELFDKGITGIATAETVASMQKTLGDMANLHKIAAENEAFLKNLDQKNPNVEKFAARLVKLQEEKNKITEKVIKNLTDKDSGASANTPNFQAEIDRLRKEFQNEFEMMKKEVANVKKDVQQLKDTVADMKEELDNKLDDFAKKLDKELEKKDLSPDQRTKAKEYFKAFLQTFSSVYVTSQVIDSGQVQLSADSTKATVLSMIVSFAPFIGSALSSSVKSLGDFLESKEMKTNARKMKRLAADPSELSQLIGRCAYEIVLHPQKQTQIFKITPEDLREVSQNLFKKITSFCNNLADKIDAFLYCELYKTPAAKLGHNDANALIEEWLNGNVDPFSAPAYFMEKILGNKQSEKPAVSDTVTGNGNRSSCCNLF